jgi:ABC-type Fe3+/spermidine/putrescine transport system ATPase subunit
MIMASLRVSQVNKSYNDLVALEPTDLTVEDGSFCCMLGSSGSGKSTLLRIIAGLSEPDGGSIHIGDRDVTRVAVERRNIGFVFQNYALFPHLSVGGNVAYGLRARGSNRKSARAKSEEMLDLVGLGGFANRPPAQLSGGQQQRVALARALVTDPDLLLLDEPLSALDRKIRGEMQRELKRIHLETGLTTVMVTHDQEEAMDLGDQVLMLDNGRMQQIGTPESLYRSPVNPFVATFLGADKIGEGVIVDGGHAVRIGEITLPLDDGHLADGTEVLAVVMAESVIVRSGGTPTDEGMHGIVTDVDFYGPFARADIQVGALGLASMMLSHHAAGICVGDAVRVEIAAGGLHAFRVPARSLPELADD